MLYFSLVAPAVCYLFFLYVVLYVFFANDENVPSNLDQVYAVACTVREKSEKKMNLKMCRVSLVYVAVEDHLCIKFARLY